MPNVVGYSVVKASVEQCYPVVVGFSDRGVALFGVYAHRSGVRTRWLFFYVCREQ